MSDLKLILKEEEKDKINETNIRKHKKPIQLRDIENRSSNRFTSKTETPENIKNLLNKEKNHIFKQPWNRLDNGMKLNRLRLFTDLEAKQRKLTKDQQENLRKLLNDALQNNKLNKNTDVIYDKSNSKIIEIKPLSFINNKYSLSFNETIKKIKKINKSKTNIERFLKKN
tara:strand:+ start:1524 stop:2033 length:510 start_codon:yes stop_codon:yes gene_type:complete